MDVSHDNVELDYACRCLNVRLSQKPLPPDKEIQQARPSPADEYEPLYVGEGGVYVAHNELTLRTRKSVLSSPSESRRKQHITVTCLVCNITVYRVLVVVPADVEAKVGPIMPTEDWVEQDVLLSTSGWIQVHLGKSGCIGSQEIKRLLSSPSYSQRYSLALVDVTHDHLTSTAPILPETKIVIPPSHVFMPDLPPFLPPPPFTPSHPIFLHLASIATAASDALRKTARANIEDFTRRELAKVEDQECQLKEQVEHLWRNIRGCLNKAQRERDASQNAALKSKRRSISPGSRSSTPNMPDSHIVRSFIPEPQYLARHITSASAPQHSALSSSLATTSFHHPSNRSSNINGQSTSTANSHAVDVPSELAIQAESSSSPPEGLTIASRSLRRNMDAENDTIVTFKWSVIEEEERKAREKRKKAEEAKPVASEGAEEKVEANKGSGVSKAPVAEASTPSSETHASSLKNGGKKSPGKRKVTFNVEPNVVTIKANDKNDEDIDTVTEGNEDLIFDFDNGDADSSSSLSRTHRKNSVVTNNAGSTSGLVFTSETSDRSQRRSRDKSNTSTAGLPSSFVALRPASLPAPSNIRPNLHVNGSSNQEPRVAAVPKSILSKKREDSPSETILPQEGHLPYQKELLKLLGADTPIHRGSWSPNSESWRIFDSSGGKGKGKLTEGDEDGGLDQSDGHDETWRQYQMPGIASSLPLSMAPISQQRANGTKSVGQKSSVSNKVSTLLNTLASVREEDEKRSSRPAAANRREAYAERDRAREIDPGILEFIPDSDDEDIDNTSDRSDEDVNQISMSRGQRSALKIIKAVESLPSEGMWRSLAS